MEFSVINDYSSPSAQASRGINVILADDGSLHDYPYNKFVSPIGLKKAPFLIDFIEKEFGINKNSQLILRNEDGKQLESSMSLEEFFQKDKTVYVFLTKGQRQEIAQDDFEVIGSITLEKKLSDPGSQLLQNVYENYLGSDIRDTLEPQVVNYYDDMMMAFSDVKCELAELKEGSIKIKRQKNSEAVLKRSLLNYYVEKKRQFDETLGQQEAKINTFQEYIDDFDSCIEKLSKQEIDPRLGEEDKKYLVNYFDLEKLNRSKGVYEKNQIKIQQKAQEIKDEILQYDNQLKNIEEALNDQSAVILELVQEQENTFADIQDTNLQGFKQIVETTKGSPAPKLFGEFIKKECETNLPKLRQISQNLISIKEKLTAFLKENAQKLKDLISDITNIRVLIKGKIYNKLKVFCSLVEKHEEGMFNLEIVEKFPLVYEQSLLEIKRRGVFKRDYMTMLNILESFANTENRFRQEFLGMYQQYLPKSFCPFLSKSFPQLKFDNIKRVVDQDLSIELEDSPQNAAEGPDNDTDVLKLLKNLSEVNNTKEIRIQELESLMQPISEENEKLKEQVKQKSLNVANLRRLFGATGFQEKIEGFLDSYKNRFTEKIDQIEKRLKEFQDVNFEKIKGNIKSQKTLEAAEKLANMSGKDKDRLVLDLQAELEETAKSLETVIEENGKLLEKLKVAEAEKIQKDEELVIKGQEIEKLSLDFESLKLEKEELADDLQMIKNGKKLNEEERKEGKAEKEQKDLTDKDTKIELLNHILEKMESELEHYKRKTEIEVNNSLVETSTTKTMLGELGGDVIDLYSRLFPGQAANKIKNHEYDMREILGDISKLVSTAMVKVDDFGIGDKVVAVRMKKSKHFLVLRKGMANLNVLHIYKSNDEKLADAIIGEIEDFGEYQEDDITGSKDNAVILVKIINIEPLCSIRI